MKKEAKAPEFPLEYPYERLTRILEDATEKAKTGKLDLEGKLLGIAAGYAKDFVDTSRAINKPLDLTGRTEEHVYLCLMRVCAENQAQKMTVAENKEIMSRKLGYYQLFSLVNSMNCEKKCTEIAIGQGILAEPRLVIRSLPDREGITHSFDALAAARDTVGKLTVLDPKKNGGAVLFGLLAPFYKRFEKDLMDYIKD